MLIHRAQYLSVNKTNMYKCTQVLLEAVSVTKHIYKHVKGNSIWKKMECKTANVELEKRQTQLLGMTQQHNR